MSDVLKMDIFFVVTTAAVVAIACLVVFALIRILRILRHVERLTTIVTEEGELLRQDVADIRSSVRREGFALKHLYQFVRKSIARALGKRK